MNNAMNNMNLVALLEDNIRTAVADYMRRTYDTSNVKDISDAFIRRLARDSAESKAELRELFRKSPAWHEDIQSLVINGTRTHDPDYYTVRNLAFRILDDVLYRDEREGLIREALNLFDDPTDPDYDLFKDDAIEALNELAPKAYAPGKKLSRVFKALCDALGVSDNTPGSKFQRLYAQFADEIQSKKLNFKLYVSINPAHFLTMSNPKEDTRGETMTSCHSLNSTDYSYNNGCSGYARDNVTFLVFTVADPSNPETLNNRKTTRQVFAYKVGNGLLLQSRMYNTSGGTEGAQAESKVYRDIVQREISDLEGAINLWNTYSSCGEHSRDVIQGDGFGGYPDWIYPYYDAKVSIRKDHENSYNPIVIGTYGLCVECATETSGGMYCDDCNPTWVCECCDEYTTSERHWVHNHYGEEIEVCDDCFERYYSCCEECNEYYDTDDLTEVDGYYLCPDCVEEKCRFCDECGEMHLESNMTEVTNSDGETIYVCNDCLEEHYVRCDECGEYYHEDCIVDGLCPECQELREIENEGA